MRRKTPASHPITIAVLLVVMVGASVFLLQQPDQVELSTNETASQSTESDSTGSVPLDIDSIGDLSQIVPTGSTSPQSTSSNPQPTQGSSTYAQFEGTQQTVQPQASTAN